MFKDTQWICAIHVNHWPVPSPFLSTVGRITIASWLSWMMASMMVMATSERRGIQIKIDLPKIWLLYTIHNALSSRQLWGRGQRGWAHLSLKPPPSPSAAFSIRLIAKSKKKKLQKVPSLKSAVIVQVFICTKFLKCFLRVFLSWITIEIVLHAL